jgi:photosystem II stability/assembly factor-like uncharacterized protein
MGRALLAGTRKGLFVVHDGETEGPLLPGWSIYHAVVDPRDGTLFAASNNAVYGATVHRSPDDGQTWERAESLGLPEDGDLKLNATWHVEPSPDALWLGGDPGVLFRSTDGGVTFEPVAGLVEHPTRDRWQPGAGGMCCHSFQVADGRLYAAISAAGAFRSDDGGETWTPINQGVAADFFPDNPFPEVGQCVHKLLAHPARDGRLWQQNHCGVYRSDDHGDTWERLEGNGLPSGFGFPIALDPSDPDVAYVVPEEGAENRVTCDGRLGVYRTDDGGASWTLEEDGLPAPAWLAVMREGMAFDDEGVYLGMQSGSVFARSRDGKWTEVARNLPPILSVEVADWS